MADQMAWLREHMRNHIAEFASGDDCENVVRFPNAPTSVNEDTQRALSLVQQAAEVIRNVEDRATATEARAEALVRDAISKLESAEHRIRALEAEHKAAHARMRESDRKLEEAEIALQHADSRVEAAEDRLSKVEAHARTCASRAEDAEKALRRIEDAIQTQLLPKRRAGSANSPAAA